MSTSVALSSHFESFIKDQIASGRYNNVSEVIREGLRLLEDREQERLRRREALKAEIQKGMDDTETHGMDEAFDEVLAMIDDMDKKKSA